MKIVKIDDKDRTVSVKKRDVDERAEYDSGAEVNFMAEHQFEALANQFRVKRTLQPSRINLSFTQSELPVKGELTVTIKNQTCGAVARFGVVRGRKINSPPPAGKKNF